MATTVNESNGIPNIIHDSTPVNMSSSALANVLSMELSDFKNRLVTIPIAALFAIISKTLRLNTRLNESYENASIRPPFEPLLGT